MSPNAMTESELKLVERVKKLHNMALGAREVGNLAEAEAFMEGVEKTLAKHNLDSSVLALDLRDLRDPMTVQGCYGATERGRQNPQEWCHLLGSYVASAHFTSMNYHIKSSFIFFYGRQSNVETTIQMYMYLRDMAEREGMKAWRRHRRETVAAYGSHVQGVDDLGWYLAWLEGFAREVGVRYRAMRARVESDTGMALVLTGVRKEAEDYSRKNLLKDEEMKDAKKVVAGGYHMDARAKGSESAKTANLRPKSMDSAEPDTSRKLSGGAK